MPGFAEHGDGSGGGQDCEGDGRGSTSRDQTTYVENAEIAVVLGLSFFAEKGQ